MAEVLLHTLRGSLVENIYRGDIAVVDKSGKLAYFCGDPEKVTYMRSAAKPMQAAAVYEHGVVEAFGFDQQELAVMCASHNGEDFHIQAIASILQKIGLTEEDLSLGADYSYNAAIRDQMLLKGLPRRKLVNNCSGKHAAMLALCVKEGWPIRGYAAAEHPCQKLMRETVAAFCEMPAEEIIVGVDGCGVSVFAMPLSRMALGWHNLQNPAMLPPQKQAAARAVTAAIAKYPQMIGGTGEFCSAVAAVTGGRIIAKKGADGIYCCAEAGGPAIALKIEDGNMAVLPQVLFATLSQLHMLREAEQAALAPFGRVDNLNCQNDKVGERIAVFTLKSL